MQSNGDDDEAPENWGLDRIDQRQLPLDNIYSPTYDGTGVDIYIIDTGITLEHNEFDNGRAACAQDFVVEKVGTTVDYPCQDLHGHGTHVAG